MPLWNSESSPPPFPLPSLATPLIMPHLSCRRSRIILAVFVYSLARSLATINFAGYPPDNFYLKRILLGPLSYWEPFLLCVVMNFPNPYSLILFSLLAAPRHYFIAPSPPSLLPDCIRRLMLLLLNTVVFGLIPFVPFSLYSLLFFEYSLSMSAPCSPYCRLPHRLLILFYSLSFTPTRAK